MLKININVSYFLHKKLHKKIIELIKKDPNITQTEMANKFGITRDGVSYNIKILKENGIIERVGSLKKGSWKIIRR